MAQCTRGVSRAPTGPLGRQLTGTMVERRSPPWAGRDGEGISGSKGGEGPARGGNRRSPPRKWVSFSSDHPGLVRCNDFKDATKAAAAIMCPAQMGLLFQPTTPALSAATISKMPLKPPLPSSTESTGVAIPNNKNADRV